MEVGAQIDAFRTFFLENVTGFLQARVGLFWDILTRGFPPEGNCPRLQLSLANGLVGEVGALNSFYRFQFVSEYEVYTTIKYQSPIQKGVGQNYSK